MVPYARFLAYLYWKQINPDRFIDEGFPLPKIQEIENLFKSAPPLKKKFLKSCGVKSKKEFIENLKSVLYIWSDVELRNLVWFLELRTIENPWEYVSRRSGRYLDPELYSFYVKLFSDFSFVEDVHLFKNQLDSLDREYFELILSDTPNDIIFKKFGFYRPSEPLIKEKLEAMFFKAVTKFELEDDLRWGRFALAVAKELKEHRTTDKDVLKDLIIELQGSSTEHKLDSDGEIG